MIGQMVIFPSKMHRGNFARFATSSRANTVMTFERSSVATDTATGWRRGYVKGQKKKTCARYDRRRNVPSRCQTDTWRNVPWSRPGHRPSCARPRSWSVGSRTRLYPWSRERSYSLVSALRSAATMSRDTFFSRSFLSPSLSSFFYFAPLTVDTLRWRYDVRS